MLYIYKLIYIKPQLISKINIDAKIGNINLENWIV